MPSKPNIPSSLSPKSKYYIPKERYLELVHFCRQYPDWKRDYESIGGITYGEDILDAHQKEWSDPTYNITQKRLRLSTKMNQVEQAAIDADSFLYPWLLKGVTEGLSYDILRASSDVPTSRDIYYETYRRFFYILNRFKE